MVFLGLDLANISLDRSIETSTTQGRSKSMEIWESSPIGGEVREEASDETSEIGADYDWM